MNLLNLILLLLQGGAGAVSGYVTNKYAVNMLFKEYTPFKALLPVKFGGVIKNRKEQFIEEISELVERDIINSNTILSNFNDENFEKVLNEIVKDFFSEELKKSIDTMEFRDIHNFEGIINNVLKCIEEILKTDSLLTDKIIDKIDLDDDITLKFIKRICKEFIQEIEKETKKNSFLYDSVRELYEKISEENISEILLNDNLNLIEKSITENIEKSLNNIFSNDKIILNILNNIYNQIDTKSIMEAMQENLYNKTLSDYIDDYELNIIQNTCIGFPQQSFCFFQYICIDFFNTFEL